MPSTLNEKQTDLLRFLSRQTGPVPVDGLDGRVVRALKSRHLVDESDGLVSVSDQGRDEFETKIRRRRAYSTYSIESGARNARAESIKRAIDALDRALPKDTKLMVGDMAADADDIMDGLRRFAGRIEGQR